MGSHRHRWHSRRARERGHHGALGRGHHWQSRASRRTGEDTAPEDPRRAPRAARRPGPSRRARARRHRAHRPRRRESLPLRKVRDLRYGENPHQHAAFYALRGEDGAMTAMQLLHGKATSFNNMLDVNAAWRIATDFPQPTVGIIKHQNPCGIASDNEITKAYRRAFMCDSVSAFGGIVGANRIVTRELAEAMEGTFYEAIVAPGYEDEALPILRNRRNLEILAVPGHAFVGGKLMRQDGGAIDFKRVAGGMLVQTPDDISTDEGSFKVVTDRSPTLEELTDLLFAWRCVKHVVSNVIVLAKGLATVGVGPGQMSRVVAVETDVRT